MKFNPGQLRGVTELGPPAGPQDRPALVFTKNRKTLNLVFVVFSTQFFVRDLLIPHFGVAGVPF